MTGSLGEQAQQTWSPSPQQPAGASKPIRAGGSFNEATTLDGSGRYGETIYYGEELFYRVKLDWGQGLAYRVTFGGLPKARPPTSAPLCSARSAPRSSPTPPPTPGSTEILPSGRKPIATPRTAYLNRNAADQLVRKASIDGWYYLVVKLGTAFGGDSAGWRTADARPGSGGGQVRRTGVRRVRRHRIHADADADADGLRLDAFRFEDRGRWQDRRCAAGQGRFLVRAAVDPPRRGPGADRRRWCSPAGTSSSQAARTADVPERAWAELA